MSSVTGEKLTTTAWVWHHRNGRDSQMQFNYTSKQKQYCNINIYITSIFGTSSNEDGLNSFSTISKQNEERDVCREARVEVGSEVTAGQEWDSEVKEGEENMLAHV